MCEDYADGCDCIDCVQQQEYSTDDDDDSQLEEVSETDSDFQDYVDLNYDPVSDSEG